MSKLFKLDTLKHLTIVLQFILPPSNSHVERVFSLMNLKWTDVGNRCSVDLVKCELMISLNIPLSESGLWTDFINLIKDDTKSLDRINIIGRNR